MSQKEESWDQTIAEVCSLKEDLHLHPWKAEAGETGGTGKKPKGWDVCLTGYPSSLQHLLQVLLNGVIL